MQEIEFHRSASHRPHNLHHWKHDPETSCFATSHKDSVQILVLEPDFKIRQSKQISLTDKSCSVIQAQVFRIEYQTILVLITEKNVQFHDVVRDAVLYTFVPNSVTAGGDSCENFASGICHLGYFIFIGLATGGLLVISRLEDGCLMFEDVLPGPRNAAITDMTSDESYIVSGDAEGGITVWEPDGQQILRVEVQFESVSNSFPVTSVLVHNDMIVAAYGSGHVRVYGVLQGRLLSEVHAHNGWINDLAIHFPESAKPHKSVNEPFLIATACDDSQIRVFTVRNDFPWISHKCDHSLRNQQVVGVTFLDGGHKLAAIAYDSCKLSIMIV